MNLTRQLGSGRMGCGSMGCGVPGVIDSGEDPEPVRMIQSAPWAELHPGFTGWLGCLFAVASPVTVTGLGRWKADAADNEAHTLKLWTDAGVELRTASVDCAALVGVGWQDAAVTPLVIPVGNYILASAEIDGGDRWYNGQPYTTAA